MKKRVISFFVLVLSILIFTIPGLYGQINPLEDINKWEADQTENFEAGDVVNYLNGNKAEGDIIYGPKYPFNGPTELISAATLDATHFVVAYDKTVSSKIGTVVIGTVSGGTISYGYEYDVVSTSVLKYISVIGLDATHFVVMYERNGSKVKAVVGTISGSTISYGSKSEFISSGSGNISAAILDATHFVVTYEGINVSGNGSCIIGAVTGSTITFGSGYTFKWGM